MHAIHDRPAPNLAEALAAFESRFTYPLGPGRSFRISHRDDYPRFFRAMGPATCFVAEKAGRVSGALSVAIRPLRDAEGAERAAAYVGDLKVDPGARGTLVLLRLAQAADAWARPQVTAAYGVVMDGAGASPADYSGRAGIERFLRVGALSVLRLDTHATGPGEAGGTPTVASAELGLSVYESLTRGRHAVFGGDPRERSESDPLWLVSPDGSACGRLEDTRRAKQLIEDDGSEMLAAHLACFAWRSPGAAAALIGAARSIAASRGFPALFTAIDARDLAPLQASLGSVQKVIAPATIYGAGLHAGPAWNINSSEI